MTTMPRLVALGSSTGGPQALQFLLTSLPDSFSAAVFVVQHMPTGFTGPFAKRLQRIVSLPVHECEREGEVVQGGHIYVAKSGHHLTLLQEDGKLSLHFPHEPLASVHKPSIDVFFSSLASLRPAFSIKAALLTGMGHDGAKGLLELRDKGGITAVQAEQDCVVFGMPKAALALKATDLALTLPALAEWLQQP